MMINSWMNLRKNSKNNICTKKYQILHLEFVKRYIAEYTMKDGIHLFPIDITNLVQLFCGYGIFMRIIMNLVYNVLNVNLM